MSTKNSLNTCLTLTACFFPVLVFGGNVEQDSLPITAGPTPVNCPKDFNEWVVWRDAIIPRLLEPRFKNGTSFIDPNQVMAQSHSISNFIDDCGKYFADQNKLTEAIGNLRAFTGVLKNNLSIPNYNHQFGYTIDDFEFLEKVKENIELPPLLRSSKFLKLISDRESYKNAYDMIIDHNKTSTPGKEWKILIYKSRFLTTPDEANTFGRFFILVPEDKYDKWIQFGIKTPNDTSSTPINNLSIVSVSKPDAQGRQLNAIVDWWRTYQSGWNVELKTRRESQGVTENCVMCHKTSPLGIHPAEEYEFDSAGKLVINTTTNGQIPAVLNKLIAGYGRKGPPYFGDGVNTWADLSSYGPELGPLIQRTDGFMQSCAADVNLNSNSINNVRDNMDCSECHSLDGLGALNFPTATNVTNSPGNQILEYISQGWMPPGNKLSADERKALFKCLTKEYHDISANQGLFVDWLKQSTSSQVTSEEMRKERAKNTQFLLMEQELKQ
ncbi:hypothetical protein AB7M22_002498 [Pseudomonas sp. ADAK2 TE3594]